MKELQCSDFEWFVENYDNLFSKYGERYLAIKNKIILGSYNSFGEAVRETAKTEEMGSFIVQFCNGDISGYTNCIATIGALAV